MEFGKILSKSIDDYKKNWEGMLATSAYLIVFMIIRLFLSELSDIFEVILNFFSIVILIGANYLCLKAARGEEFSVSDLFIGFKERTGRLLLLELLIGLFSFLWGLLLIIPGIIKGMAYSQAFYIYLDNPELTASECISESEDIMDGFKTDYFVLNLLFSLVLLLLFLPVIIFAAAINFFELTDTVWIRIIFRAWNYTLYPFFILFNTNFYLRLTLWDFSGKTEETDRGLIEIKEN